MRITIVLFCKKQRDLKKSIEAQFDDQDLRERTHTTENDETGSRTLHLDNMQSTLFETNFDRRYPWDASSGNEGNSKRLQFDSSLRDWTEISIYNEQPSRVNSQMDYLSESTNTNSTNQRETYKYHGQLPRNGNSREEVTSLHREFARRDFPFSSTQNEETFEFKRPFPKLYVTSNGLNYPENESDITLRGCTALFPDKSGQVSDSLASTVLSVAASESQPTRSSIQQSRDLLAKSIGFHDKNSEDQTGLPSTRQITNRQTDSKTVSEKQESEKQKARNITVVQDQDKTLANLEKLRHKLLEEKQKQLDALRQQELKRLRKQKRGQGIDFEHTHASFYSHSQHPSTGRPQSSSVPLTKQSDLTQALLEESEKDTVTDRSSADYHRPGKAPLRRPISMHPGEMYSILELSGENLDFDNHDEDNLEPESSSDKENHVGEEASRGNRHNTVAENILGGVTVRRKSEQKHMNPFITQMDPKIFSQEVDDRFVYNGRDKFAKLSAHAKGFLTRLLMTTDKVQGLIKTVKDTRDVLEDICKEETQSVQEKMLKENVEGHLRIARGSLHDVFFKISVKERMSYIAHSRELARTKEAKRRNSRSWIGQSKLSAVTLRAIQRRQEGLDSSVTQTANSEVKPKPEPKEEKKRKTWNIRVLKPQQGHTSPPLPDRTRSKKPNSRPATAPEKPLNSRFQKDDTLYRPKTTDGTLRKPVKSSRSSLGGGHQPPNRPARQSIGSITKQPKVTVQPRAKKRLSLPESAQPRMKGHVATKDAIQRPKTASEVKRSSRTLAANFSN